MAHMNLGKEILDSFAAKLEDCAVIEKAAKLEGRNMIMFLSEKR
jgi:translation initiation factor IF-3